MADGSADDLPTRGIRTICLPITEEKYNELISDAKLFREWLQESAQLYPELFPIGFDLGFEMKDQRTSQKLGIPLRRIRLRNGESFTVRPCFVMPYMTALTADVEKGLFLRRFGVPLWAVSYVLGRDPMFWFRQEIALGRNSIVGTTVHKVDIPEHLVADEHHQTLNGDKVYLATTVGGGCILGAEVAPTGSIEDLTKAYGVFQEEARDVEPEYQPLTVNTDGWKGTRASWKVLYPTIVLLRCILHAWLKIRDRGKGLKQTFFKLGDLVWGAYRAVTKSSFSQRIRRLKTWANQNLSGTVHNEVIDLCDKKDLWLEAYDHPGGHRTSNMLDRAMRPMNRYFENGQHLHGKHGRTTRLHVRGFCLLHNFSPWHPATTKANAGWQSPAEKLNQYRYADNWLKNLMVSTSLGGYKHSPQKA